MYSCPYCGSKRVFSFGISPEETDIDIVALNDDQEIPEVPYYLSADYCADCHRVCIAEVSANNPEVKMVSYRQKQYLKKLSKATKIEVKDIDSLSLEEANILIKKLQNEPKKVAPIPKATIKQKNYINELRTQCGYSLYANLNLETINVLDAKDIIQDLERQVRRS